MKTDGLGRILSLGVAALSAGFVGLSAYLLMQDDDTTDNSLYGAPLGRERLVKALQENLSADLDTIEAHGDALLDRNPRMTLPRGALASIYAQRGQIEAFERVFYPIFHIDRRNTGSYATALAKMSRDERVFERAQAKVREEQPAWGGLYLRRLLSETDRDVTDYQELMRLYPRQQGVFVREVMAKRGIEQAYASFETIADTGSMRATGLIDPDFTDDTYSWPFGWLLDRETVSREPGGGLAIVFFGRGTPFIAQQVTRVEPGSYMLVMLANGDASRTKGYFRLEARCWQGQSLVDLTLDDISAAPMEYNLRFDTSELQACDFVHVRLIGQAGAFPAPVRLRVKSLNLRPSAPGEAQ